MRNNSLTGGRNQLGNRSHWVSCTLLPRQNTLENVLKTCLRVHCYLSGHIALRWCKTLHCLDQSSFEKTSAVSRVACTMRHTEAAAAPASSYHPGHSKGDLSSWSPGHPQQRTPGTTFTEGGPPLLQERKSCSRLSRFQKEARTRMQLGPCPDILGASYQAKKTALRACPEGEALYF